MFSPLLLISLLSTVSADCTRSFLKNATDQYLLAQSTGQDEVVKAFIDDAAGYRENNRNLALEASTLTIPLKIDFSRSLVDTVNCRTFTEIIAKSEPHPFVIHTRMEFSNQTGKSTGIESVVTDKGDWLFNATGTYELNKVEDWSPIPVEKRDSRATIQAVGDAYFDRFGNVSVTVPWGPPCVRVEGGLAASGTLNENGDCIQAWPSTIYVPYRRYVIDEEYGVASLFVGFPGLDRTQGEDPMPDSHLFRVEGGKIRYLHTASACVTEGCGLNSTTFPTFRL